VAGLYHDIGKLRRPHCFVENQSGENIHDRLSPQLSALVILAHVKDGLELGRALRLPQPVLDIIAQHHGTGLISYFYERAVQQTQQSAGHNLPQSTLGAFGRRAGDDTATQNSFANASAINADGSNAFPRNAAAENVAAESAPSAAIVSNVIVSNVPLPDESLFRYAGPRPQSKEAAIVMLADSIEASARSLSEPTPERVQMHIESMIARRLQEGELSDSDLTLRDLQKIESSFAHVMRGVLHHRIEYPDPNRDAPNGMAADGARHNAMPVTPRRNRQEARRKTREPKRRRQSDQAVQGQQKPAGAQAPNGAPDTLAVQKPAAAAPQANGNIHAGNSQDSNDHSANGHVVSSHAVNGHGANGHNNGVNGHNTNCHDSNGSYQNGTSGHSNQVSGAAAKGREARRSR
ncbi:MAG: cyclic-di-AMP phosphodiesterase PgpH, partial [Abditibacteriota bacterium]|nr:cyclic-di-AMP phosphodiesterase PgpH [Abditibacteriota bacterium]